MIHQEYLLSFGTLGDFGRFHAVKPLTCRRGQRAVVRTVRVLEIATVLGEAQPGHARFLPNTSVGQLLRLTTLADEQAEHRCRDESRRLFEESRALATSLGLPLEVIDTEVLFDGEHAVVHYLRAADFDARPFVSALSRTFDVHISLFDLTEPAAPEDHGCGRPDCGSGGGCGSHDGCETCGLKAMLTQR